MRLMRLVAIAVLLLAAPAAAVAQTRTLRIGTEGANPSFNEIDASGKLFGFDIDIARALCAQMRVTCTFVTQPWDDLIPGLLAGKFDAIVSSMTITPERQRKVAFSDRYYSAPGTFAIQTGKPITDVTPAALRGKTLGAQLGTTSAAYLKARYGRSRVKLFSTQDEATAALAAGRIDALLADKFQIYEWLQQAESGGCCRFVGTELADMNPAGQGIAVRKEDTDLLAKLNRALKAIKADGTYRKINEKYFPFSIE